MSVTKKKIDESAFVLAKDNTNKNIQAVVVPSSFQVGLKDSPSDLTLTGKFSVSEKDYTADSSNNWNVSIEDHVTVAAIKTTYSSSSTPPSGYVRINLPKNPRVGQLVIVKDFSGVCGSLPIRIYDLDFIFTKIDGTSYKEISSDYGSLQFLWQGRNWISVSSSGGSGAQGYQGYQGAQGSSGGGGGSQGAQGYQGYQGYQGPGFNSISSPANNRILTSDGTSNAAVAEANLTFDGSVLTVTGGTATSAEGIIGAAEVGTHPSFGSTRAMFGHKDIDHSDGTKYALIQTDDGYTSINSPIDKGIYLKSNDVSLATISFSTFGGGTSFLSLTGAPSYNVYSTLGNSWGASTTAINAGTGGITLSGSATTIITGSTSGEADAYIGSAEVGTHPLFGRNYAMFGHKDIIHSAGTNYSLLQGNDGATYINSPQDTKISFRANNTELGYITYNSTQLSSSAYFTGNPSFTHTVALGNNWTGSKTSIYGGTGGITLSGSGATTTITGSSNANAEVYIGTAEIGELPYTRASFPNYFAMFGHKTLDHSSNGNYALVQSYDGDTFLNASNAKSIYIQNAGNLIGVLDNDNITLTGQSNSSVATVLGNSYGLSYTNINAGILGITLSGSATTTITGSTSGQADVYIGSAEVGTHPFWGRNYAMFSHKDMDNSSDGNAALIQSYDGDTFLGAKSGKSVYIKNGTSFLGTINSFYTTLSGSAFSTLVGNSTSISGNINLSLYGGTNGITASSKADIVLDAAQDYYTYFKSNGNELGYIGYSSLFGSLINLTGRSGFRTAIDVGGNSNSSVTNIYAGTGGINLSGSATTTITGSTSGEADAYIGSAEIGVHPFWGRNYAMFGHKDLNNASDGNAAIIQSSIGDTFLGSSNNSYLYFKNGTRTLGYFQYSTFFGKTIFSLDGSSGSPTSVTIGNAESSSNLTLNAGSGSIDIGTTPQSRSTNIATGAAVQTVTVGSSNSTSTLTLDAGSGGINIGTNPGGSSKTINVGTTAAINTDVNIGSEYLASKTVVKAGGIFGSLGGLYLSGSAATTYTVGGETGIGTITLGRSVASNVIDIGAAGNNTSNTQTINIGNGTGRSTITIGSQAGLSSLTLDAGGGNIDIGTSATARSINIGTGAANQTISIGNNSTANQVAIYGGTPFLGAGGLYLTGSIGTTYTVGGEGGTGTITIGRSNDTNTISIGSSNRKSGATQTINIGTGTGADSTSPFAINIGTGTGGGTSGSPRTINIGEYGAGYSQVNVEADFVNIANNAASKLGFFATGPVVQQTGGAATADLTYTSNERDMINAMWTALRAYGLLT